MKKDVTEPRVFCDFCGEPASEECLVCGKDLCRDHRLVLRVFLDIEERGFRASLCRDDAQPLVPFLMSLQSKRVGHDLEFSEARLTKILEFLK